VAAKTQATIASCARRHQERFIIIVDASPKEPWKALQVQLVGVFTDENAVFLRQCKRILKEPLLNFLNESEDEAVKAVFQLKTEQRDLNSKAQLINLYFYLHFPYSK
jgi:hypothetical protein